MGGKAEIYEVPAVLYRLLNIGLHKKPKLIQVINPPYNIVSQPDIVKILIHLRNA